MRPGGRPERAPRSAWPSRDGVSAIATLFCRNASVAASTRTSTASFEPLEPLEDIVQSSRDDADFVQTVDRHAGGRLACRGPLHRLAHLREPPIHQQPCGLIDQQRHEQDAAQGEPECRLVPDAPPCGD